MSEELYYHQVAETVDTSKWQCMIDLETFALTPNAMIISIGAVKFDPTADKLIMADFHCAVDPVSAMQWKFDIEPGTVLFWMSDAQDEARRNWMGTPKVDLASTLDAFTSWYGPTSMPTWSNGADFDLPILKNAFTKLGFRTPWKYSDTRCFRTMKNITDVPPPPSTGMLHNALSDATWQTRYLAKVYDRLKEINSSDT